MRTLVLETCLVALALAGCADGELDVDAAAAGAMAKNPFAEVEPPRPDQAELVGTVVERLPAGSYTYLALSGDDGRPRWVVTMKRGFSVGDRVHVKNMGTRRDFHSKRLGRAFDELVFGVVRPARPDQEDT
ncbi:MAG: hypothetical protein JNL21_33610 [Myxococcales bacterium]|nr:hypothetical protein [Myxococcales bacterium]